MEYLFCINDFEGPLDLLLHLVKTSKMDIYEIDIRIIIEEYLDFIKREKEKNIDIASSYLVMSAELIHLKSKMLLNLNNEETDNNGDEEFSINSEEDLKNKIIEYEKYKLLTKSLEEKRLKRSNFYTKSPMKLDEFIVNKAPSFGSVSLEDLIEALKKFKMREKLAKPINTKITKKEYNMDKRINDIRNILKVRDSIEFLELFNDYNKDFVIVTFLAILTMSKNKEINLLQEANFKTIIIERGEVHE